MNYSVTDPEKAYTLLNCGGVILVCTKSPAGRYDLAPVAWSCPLDYEPVSRILFVCDPAHATHENLIAGGTFVVALPTPAQLDIVRRTGSCSGKDKDKYAEYSIASFSARKIDALVPEGVAAWLECRLIRAVREGSVSVVFGEVIHAEAAAEAWKERLHYVSEKLFYSPGPVLDLK